MAGFTLPKLKWLVLGAVAAGVWAMNQEPPKREHWQRQRASETASVEKKKPTAEARVVQKPSPMITSSIPRPQKPIVAQPEPQTLRTTEKVRLRKDASTSSAVVAMLKAGQSVEASASEGKWRKVSVEGLVGWVHSDYLAGKPAASSTATAAIARPKAELAPQSRPAAAVPVVASPADKSIWERFARRARRRVATANAPTT